MNTQLAASPSAPYGYYEQPVFAMPKRRPFSYSFWGKLTSENTLPSHRFHRIPLTEKSTMSTTSTMSGRIFETMDSVRVGGTTRLIALSLPISTFILMFSIGSRLGHAMPKHGIAAFLTLTVAYLLATVLTTTAWNENGTLREGDRLVLIAAATISVALGFFAAAFFWVM